MGFWLSPVVSAQELYTTRVDTKGDDQTPCYNLIITYSNPQFELFS